VAPLSGPLRQCGRLAPPHHTAVNPGLAAPSAPSHARRLVVTSAACPCTCLFMPAALSHALAACHLPRGRSRRTDWPLPQRTSTHRPGKLLGNNIHLSSTQSAMQPARAHPLTALETAALPPTSHHGVAVLPRTGRSSRSAPTTPSCPSAPLSGRYLLTAPPVSRSILPR
jgi:hypothetical protein